MGQSALNMDAFVEGAKALGVSLDVAQVSLFHRYFRELVSWNTRVNLVAQSTLASAPATHFLDSLVAVDHLRRCGLERSRLLDVGSGAGFPALPLKIALPVLRVELVESVEKKAAFLKRLSTALEVDNVEVWNMRSEDAARLPELRQQLDVVTARALAPFPVVLELTLPFLRLGGRLLAWRGIEAQTEAAANEDVARQLGGKVMDVEDVRVPGIRDYGHLVIVVKEDETASRYPRKAGLPAKRPLR